MMFISTALAHGNTQTGSTGGGDAVLIILAVALVLAFGYSQHKKMRRLAKASAVEANG
ncbi:MAG: hypothetical protein VCD33_14890 [Alphaproteobacteria bacterium]